MNDLTKQLNNDLVKVGLPELSSTKTKTYVRINDELNNTPDKDLVTIVKDYGLLIPILFLSDINVDYAKFLTGDTDIDVSGFVRYVDTQLLVLTKHDLNTMKAYFAHIPSFEPKGQTVDELREEYVQFVLEFCINSRYKSQTENILELERLIVA